MLFSIDGNLTTFPCDVIVQQANCMTTRPHGLSQVLARTVGVDAYAGRIEGMPNVATPETRPAPGTIRIQPSSSSPAASCRFVVSLFAQYMPGRVGDGRIKFERERHRAGIVETPETREAWFKASLDRLADAIVADPTIRSVAFPHGIACGLAGGRWSAYESMIRAFHDDLVARRHRPVDVTVVRLA